MLGSPELAALADRSNPIRIPDETDVPVTPRVRRLIDSRAFRRLASIPQLGLVSLVYPGATHSRFEHSLGVYANALAFVDRLARDDRFARAVDEPLVSTLFVAALLHDVGHWPFCHPIEDLSLDGVPSHERFAERWLHDAELAGLLRRDWGLEPAAVLRLLDGPCETPGERIAASILSGPIDVDKLDYLYRDSLHAGVPYGRHFDRRRLISGLCLDDAGTRIAIDDKAKTAAELMVFARYVMFSEVYWHHAVRSATAMFQRVFFQAHRLGAATSGGWDDWFLDEPAGFVARASRAVGATPVAAIADALFGPHRRLFKRLAQFEPTVGGETYRLVARRPYDWLVDCGERLARRIGEATGVPLGGHQLLIDAPPIGMEVEFRVSVRDARRGTYRMLGEVSPVIETLATRQFDDFVKRVRVFVHPDAIEGLRERLARPGTPTIEELLQEAAAEIDANG